MDPSNDNPPRRAGANPFSGHGYYNPFARLVRLSWSRTAGCRRGQTGGVGGMAMRSSPYSLSLTAPAAGPTLPQKRPPLWDDPNHIPGPGKYSTANEPDQPDTGQRLETPQTGRVRRDSPVRRLIRGGSFHSDARAVASSTEWETLIPLGRVLHREVSSRLSARAR